jgi:hypothetical protein
MTESFDILVRFNAFDKMAQLKWAILESKIEDQYEIVEFSIDTKNQGTQMECLIHFQNLEDNIHFLLSHNLSQGQPFLI